ncbi:hypothetical protein [Mucilaginibacter pedocola]|uniref:Uncharacterized protein n=1 Tax=Mucilaginibacter pedocola TaxID=1792845 RepID=A0A1S9PB09_9SPHI|nr:hypothetical protein [Mucilaginibacter pedocola]OOQ58145.1 hypothetical protein BC343_10870 [Mucilaginibacter pedocola]
MKQQEVFKKIGVIIQEINEQYEYLQSSVENLNDLELELFVANTHFLKDHAEILRKLNAIKSQPVAKTSIKDEPKWFEPMVQPAKPAPAPFKADTPKPINNDSIKFEIVPPADEEELKFETLGESEVESLKSEVESPQSVQEKEETEAIRHELVLDEADNFEDEEEGQSQDELLLTPVAEIEEEEQSEVESPKSEEKEEQSEVESLQSEEESIEPEVEEVPEVEAEAEPQPEPVIEEEPVAEEPEPVIEEVPEPVAEVEQEQEPESEPETTPEPVIEEEEESAPLTLFDAPKVKGKKALAESMEDIQLESFKPKEEEKEQVLTLNQRLSAQKKEAKPAATAEPAEHIEPLSDIKTAITLNDKLLFVKDLFKGYNLAYTEAIEIVNRFSNFEEADRFLKNNYVTKNNWEGKKETSDKFYALLRRRYA